MLVGFLKVMMYVRRSSTCTVWFGIEGVVTICQELSVASVSSGVSAGAGVSGGVGAVAVASLGVFFGVGERDLSLRGLIGGVGGCIGCPSASTSERGDCCMDAQLRSMSARSRSAVLGRIVSSCWLKSLRFAKAASAFWSAVLAVRGVLVSYIQSSSPSSMPSLAIRSVRCWNAESLSSNVVPSKVGSCCSAMLRLCAVVSALSMCSVTSVSCGVSSVLLFFPGDSSVSTSAVAADAAVPAGSIGVDGSGVGFFVGVGGLISAAASVGRSTAGAVAVVAACVVGVVGCLLLLDVGCFVGFGVLSSACSSAALVELGAYCMSRWYIWIVSLYWSRGSVSSGGIAFLSRSASSASSRSWSSCRAVVRRISACCSWFTRNFLCSIASLRSFESMFILMSTFLRAMCTWSKACCASVMVGGGGFGSGLLSMMLWMMSTAVLSACLESGSYRGSSAVARTAWSAVVIGSWSVRGVGGCWLRVV